MRKAVILLLALLLVGAVGYGTSGQDVVRGTVTGEGGTSLSDCEVARGWRVGVGFGGFDGPAYGTGAGGQFALPVNRGVNRLTFACAGGVHGAVTTLVVRGRKTRVAVVLGQRQNGLRTADAHDAHLPAAPLGGPAGSRPPRLFVEERRQTGD